MELELLLTGSTASKVSDWPALNICGLFSGWTCKINPLVLGNIPSVRLPLKLSVEKVANHVTVKFLAINLQAASTTH